LATPTKCGTYAVNSEFDPGATGLPNQTSTQFFKITRVRVAVPPGANRPFKPRLQSSGRHKRRRPLTARSRSTITRQDGRNQTLSTIATHTPPGFSATLKGIPYCPDATLNAIAPRASGVSELNNPKSRPQARSAFFLGRSRSRLKALHAPGRVYLAGPYKRRSAQLRGHHPAVSGHYDLGNVRQTGWRSRSIR